MSSRIRPTKSNSHAGHHTPQTRNRWATTRSRRDAAVEVAALVGLGLFFGVLAATLFFGLLALATRGAVGVECGSGGGCSQTGHRSHG